MPIEFRDDFENMTTDLLEKKRPPRTRKNN